MKIIDFEYLGEYSFWEYRYQNERLGKELRPPNNETTLSKVVLRESSEYCLNDFLPFPGQSCIIMVTSPWKNTIWSEGKDQYRSRCYTKIIIEHPKDVILTKYDNNAEEFFVIQGNWHTIDIIQPRAFYKNWIDEVNVQRLRNKPVPDYIKEYDKNWGIIDNDSPITIVNCTDAGWWFTEHSYTPWYNPYSITWKNSNINVLNWRTSVDQQFSFGFDMSPQETARKHRELIDYHFPNTEKVVYFGQCLGSSKTMQTAWESDIATCCYISSTFFHPMYHRSKNLYELANIEVPDAIETVRDLKKDICNTYLLYKSGDQEEREEYGRYMYNIGKHNKIKHHMINYLDVYAPVLSDQTYGIWKFIESNPPNTQIENNFKENRVKKTFESHA